MRLDTTRVVCVLQGKLQVPHSLALDTCANAIYVADRGASAVRRFNIAGEFAGAEPLAYAVIPPYILAASKPSHLLSRTASSSMPASRVKVSSAAQHASRRGRQRCG